MVAHEASVTYERESNLVKKVTPFGTALSVGAH
jgi:hypothetical protein